MDLNKGIQDIEKIRLDLMAKLSPAQQRSVIDATKELEKATTPEELEKVTAEQIQKLENEYKDNPEKR